MDYPGWIADLLGSIISLRTINLITLRLEQDDLSWAIRVEKVVEDAIDHLLPEEQSYIETF